MSDIDIRSGLSEEEIKRLERIDRIDSNKKRKKLIMTAVTVILILFFVFGTVFGGMHILSYEGTEALPQEAINYPALPENAEDTVSSFIKLLEDTKNYNGVKLNVYFDVSLVDDSIVIEGEKAESVKAAAEYVKPSVLSMISSRYDSQRIGGKYGEDFSGVLFPVTSIDKNVEISAVTEEENENNLKYVFDYDEKVMETADDAALRELFALEADKAVISELTELISSAVNVGEMKVTYEDFLMTANIDRLKNELNGIEQKRVYNIVLPLEFIGEYKEFGSLTLSFKLEFVKRFNFSRVQFYFVSDVYYIEKGSSDEFKTKVISDQSVSEIKVTLTSSDTSVLSIDGSFYKGEKVSAEPVTVTGTYTYNGITYEDTCIFYVRVPVEGVKVNEKEVTLKKGETKTVDITLSPDDATLTKVYWFTTDEEIVSVDENGTVTAKNTGTASVYCITQDGNYKSSCNIIITE